MRSKQVLRAAAFTAVAFMGLKSFAHPNYTGTPAPGLAAPGPIVLMPGEVVGKEYVPGPSPFFPGGGNITVLPPLHGFDNHQVTAWDSNPLAVPPPPPGMADSVVDYTPFLPAPLANTWVDALANHSDLFYAPGYYRSVVLDTSALLFSVTSDSGFGSGVGGAPILFERIAPAGGGGGIWAIPPMIAHGHPGSPLPNAVGGDMDGLEVWGADGAAADDSNRFSLNGMGGPDPGGVAVWAQVGGPAGPVLPMVSDAMVAALILPFAPDGTPIELIENYLDLDALMFDDRDGTGAPADEGIVTPGLDHMLFSIRPIPGVFDGGEIWDTDFTPVGTAFLIHGGHLWDTAFDVMGTYGTVAENVDALEAVATVPEPGCISAMLLGLGVMAARRRARAN